jgi:hypothetical protein
MTSATVNGVARDAEHIVKAITSRVQAGAEKEDWNERSSEAA